MRRILALGLAGLAGVAWNQALAPKGFSFDPGTGVSNRLLTPNGDGKNDFVIFSFANPRISSVGGSIYDINGKFVASMATVSDTQLRWDGKNGSTSVSSGIYLYLIEAEEAVYSGTLVVIR